MKTSALSTLTRSTVLIALSTLPWLRATPIAVIDGPFQATGIKIGEVTDISATIWVRLTRRSKRGHDLPISMVGGGRKKRKNKNKKVSGDSRVEDQDIAEWVSWPEVLEESAPGTSGFARVTYQPLNQDEGSRSTLWTPVNDLKDYTRQFTLRNLTPNQRYSVIVESMSLSRIPGETVRGGFRTAPSSNESESIVFTVASCTPKKSDYKDGYRIYPQMLKLDPNFFVHTGDMVYYDRLAKTVDIARHHWHWAYTWPTNTEFHRRVSSYFMKDDHDTWQDDCYPTMRSLEMEYFTFSQGQGIFLEQVPMGEKTYRTFRWGKHLQIWLVEGRDFRSPNDAPDGPDKTIWGKEQLEWFMHTVRKSDATFRVLISPTPVVGPDRGNHKDNHSNRAFKHEGSNLRRFLAAQNMIVICGDRHWQYMSVHHRVGLREYSVGPTTDDHTGNLGELMERDGGNPAHRYANTTTGGFLSATVDAVDGTPSLTLRFHGVMGNINFEDTIVADVEDEPSPLIEEREDMGTRKRRNRRPEEKREDLFVRDPRT